MSETVHIVALGARTPVGLGAVASAAAVRAGVSRLVLHPFMADQLNENVRGAIDGAYDAGIIGPQRIAALAGFALAEVLAGLPAELPQSSVPVFVALPESRPGLQTSDEQNIVTELERAQAVAGRTVRVRISGRGHAGALETIGSVAGEIRAGRDEVCIVGGADSYFDFDTLDWLQDHRQLTNRETRSGFPPGEAAGFVALAGERTRRRLKLGSHGVLRGWGTGQEKRLIKSDDPSLGTGLANAITAATAGLRLPEEAAHDMYCDLNGERYRSEEWSLAVLRVPYAVRAKDYVAPVDCWGDIGAAIGPLSCVLASRAWARAYAQGTRALIWAGSESGLRSALVLEAPGQA
jgi:3-oxoacyl-[acyl-carrier-protein] synthase-1